MHRGFIVLWRKIQDAPFYRDSYAVHLAIHMILEANHAPKKIIFNGKEEVLERGQMLTGRHVLAGNTGIAPSTVYKKLDMLKNIGFCSIKSNNKFSIVTISNYSIYQNIEIGEEHQKEQQRSSSVAAREQPGSSSVAQTTIQPYNHTTIKTIKPIVSSTKLVQDFFYKQHLDKFGEPYVADFAKDGAIFKGILKILPPDRVTQLITYFFKSDDEFIKQAGYTTGVFKSQINKLRNPRGASQAVLELEEIMKNDKSP